MKIGAAYADVFQFNLKFAGTGLGDFTLIPFHFHGAGHNGYLHRSFHKKYLLV